MDCHKKSKGLHQEYLLYPTAQKVTLTTAISDNIAPGILEFFAQIFKSFGMFEKIFFKVLFSLAFFCILTS